MKERMGFESNYMIVFVMLEAGKQDKRYKNGHGEAHWGMHCCILALLLVKLEIFLLFH